MSYHFIYLLMTLIYSLKQATMILQTTVNWEMGKLVNWLHSNCLALNVSKTNFIIFSAKNKPVIPVTIIINRQAIGNKDHVKYLGILIDSKLILAT